MLLLGLSVRRRSNERVNVSGLVNARAFLTARGGYVAECVVREGSSPVAQCALPAHIRGIIGIIQFRGGAVAHVLEGIEKIIPACRAGGSQSHGNQQIRWLQGGAKIADVNILTRQWAKAIAMWVIPWHFSPIGRAMPPAGGKRGSSCKIQQLALRNRSGAAQGVLGRCPFHFHEQRLSLFVALLGEL